MFPQSDHADEFSNKNGVYLHQLCPPPRSQGKKKSYRKELAILASKKSRL